MKFRQRLTNVCGGALLLMLIFIFPIQAQTEEWEIEREDRLYEQLVGDWIYYIKYVGGDEEFHQSYGYLYKIKKDGSGRTQLTEELINHFAIDDSWIYYATYDEHGAYYDYEDYNFYRMKHDGSSKAKISSHEAAGVLIVENDWVYFTNKFDQDRLYRLRVDGSERMELTDDSVSYNQIQVLNDWVLYYNDYSTYIMRTDGSSNAILKDGSYIWAEKIENDWVYYLKYNPETRENLLKRIRLDGMVEEDVQIPGATAPLQHWQVAYGKDISNKGTDIQQTSDGGYIAVGTAWSGNTTNPDKSEIYVVKMDQQGAKQWEQTYNQLGSKSTGSAIKPTNDGGYIIVGSLTEPYYENKYTYLIKINNKGEKNWEKRLGVSSSGSSVLETTEGDYIIGSTLKGFTGGTYSNLTKTDASGEVQWSKGFSIGDSTYSSLTDIQITDDGGYIASGTTQTSEGMRAFLYKTDSLGNEEWEKTYGLANKRTNGTGLVISMDGQFVLSGYTTDSENNQSIYLLKTDQTGNIQWERTIKKEGALMTWGYDLEETSDGGFLVSGGVSGQQEDIYLVKTDVSGRKRWEATWGGSQGETSYASIQSSDGGYVVLSYSNLAKKYEMRKLQPDEIAVTFLDADLEKAVRQKLNKLDGIITTHDMITLEELDIAYQNITDLTGLEYAINLEKLYASHNDIGRLYPIRFLTHLKDVDLSSNPINKTEDLQLLSHLERLNLGEIWQLKVADLNYLDQLEVLNISGTYPENIEKLDLSHLQEIDLTQCGISSFSEIRQLTGLRKLNLNVNQIETIGDVNFPELEELYLDTNMLRDLKGIENLNQLTTLVVRQNLLKDLSGVEYLNKLKGLDASRNQLTDISLLQSSVTLESVNLKFNKIVDIDPVRQWSQIQFLDLQENEIFDISPLLSIGEAEGLGPEVQINLVNNHLNLMDELSDDFKVFQTLLGYGTTIYTDPQDTFVPFRDGALQGALAGFLNLDRLNYWDMDRLKYVYIDTSANSYAKIRDLYGIQYAVNVEVLTLSNHSIQDISPLTQLPNLSGLRISYNPVKDLSPLLKIPKLENVDITGIPLDAVDLEVVQRLLQKGIRVENGGPVAVDPDLNKDSVIDILDTVKGSKLGTKEYIQKIMEQYGKLINY